MSKYIDDGMDYSEFTYKNFRGNNAEEVDNRYYITNRSGGGDSITLRAIEPDEIDNIPYRPIHTVEYITPQIETQGKEIKKKRKSNTNPIRNRAVVLVVMTIILCSIGGVLIADALSNGYILDDMQAVFTGKKQESRSYYAIEMLNFTDMNSAKIYAQEIRGMGGGGYVVNDQLYRVIAEVFDNKEDCDQVVTKLNTSGYMARAYEIVMTAPDYSVLPSSVRNISKTALKYLHETFSKMNGCIISLASGKADRNKTVSDLKTLRASLSAQLIDYEFNCDDQADDSYVVRIRGQLSMMVASLDNLCNSADNSVGLLADMRYTNIMMLNTHRVLSRDISIIKDKS